MTHSVEPTDAPKADLQPNLHTNPHTNPHTTSGPALSRVWSRIRSYVQLPTEVSAFEAAYLQRMHRVTQWFLAAHLPVLMLVAAANGTGVVSVGVMTSVVLVGLVFGRLAFGLGRKQTYVAAFTTMSLGGVLVHAGQGPVQIEMHFYFFSVLAMLSLFGNPLTVLVGAATIAAHHLVLWYLAPGSVFNYEAPLWVVLVHAGFVLLESAAACYIARTFFDSVIGLERKVQRRTAELEERNRETRLVLDSVDQGLVTLDASGALLAEHSSAWTELFGHYRPGEPFSDLLARSCVTTSEWFSLSWDAVDDGFLPLELALEQLPSAAQIRGRELTLEYRPSLRKDGTLESLLVVATDVTEEVGRRRDENQQREIVTMLEWALKDPGGFAAFCEEASKVVEDVTGIATAQPSLDQRRAAHTLKGNAATYGLGSISAAAHALEDAWADGSDADVSAQRDALGSRWRALMGTAMQLLGDRSSDQVSVEADELERLMNLAIEARSPEIATGIADVLLEPVSPALERLEAQALQIAERLDRAPLSMTVTAEGVRVPRGAFHPLFSALVHVVRNAVDHGIESREERVASDKPEEGQLEIRSRIEDDMLVVEIEDDGRGVDWNAVAARAQRLGLAHHSNEDLRTALFAAELSTRENVTEFSGRGVGLSALLSTIENLDGSIDVRSEEGAGTCVTVRVPVQAPAWSSGS